MKTTLIKQKGVALIIVLILVLVATSAMLTVTNRSTVDVRIAKNDQLSKEALYVAEAGLMETYQLLENHMKANPILENLSLDLADGGRGSNADPLSGFQGFGNLATYNGVDYRSNVFNGHTYYTRIQDNIDDNDLTTDSDERIWINTVGVVNGAERELWAYVKTVSTTPGLYGLSSLEFNAGNVVVDSYDSSQGIYGALLPGGGTNVDDDALVGSNEFVENKGLIGGSIQTSGDLVMTGSVTGEIEYQEEDLIFPPVSPCTDPAPAGQGGYSATSGMTPVPGQSGNILSYINNSVDVKKIVEMQPGIYCFNDLKVGASGEIRLLGPVEIYVTGNIDLAGSGITNTSANPSDLQVYSTGGDVKITGNSDTIMDLYAPNSVVDIGGTADFMGRAIGDVVKVFTTGDIHIDDNLTEDREFILRGWRDQRG